jgi:cellulose biosynthesis protein BcsQ
MTSQTRNPIRVTVYNKKGGVGKSTISGLLALDWDFFLATNEMDAPIADILPEDRVNLISPDQRFKNMAGDRVVFDLAGAMSPYSQPSIESAIEQSDVVLVPMVAEHMDISQGHTTIAQIIDIGTPIIVIANKIQAVGRERISDIRATSMFETVQANITEIYGTDIPVMPLRQVNAMKAMFEKDMGLKDMIRERPLLAKNYGGIMSDFRAIVEIMETYYA